MNEQTLEEFGIKAEEIPNGTKVKKKKIILVKIFKKHTNFIIKIKVILFANNIPGIFVASFLSDEKFSLY